MKLWNKIRDTKQTALLRKIVSYLKRIFLKNTRMKIAALLVLVALAIFSINYFYVNEEKSIPIQSTSEQIKLDKVDKSKIDFQTVTPDGKSIEQLGGWTKINPPTAKDLVVAYADKIDSVNIRVSQQALPDDLKGNSQSNIQNIAHGLGADQKLSTSDNSIYIGTFSNQAQSLIFEKNNLLILITSDGLVSTDGWLRYIDSLR